MYTEQYTSWLHRCWTFLTSSSYFETDINWKCTPRFVLRIKAISVLWFNDGQSEKPGFHIRHVIGDGSKAFSVFFDETRLSLRCAWNWFWHLCEQFSFKNWPAWISRSSSWKPQISSTTIKTGSVVTFRGEKKWIKIGITRRTPIVYYIFFLDLIFCNQTLNAKDK